MKARIVFFGCTKFSEEILKHIKVNELASVVGIVSAPEYFSISYSDKPVKNYNFADLSHFSSPGCWHEVFDKNRPYSLAEISQKISEAKPDIILVAGWYYMVGKSIRALARLGAWGVHSSLLPQYAGGAPLVWAMLNGETQTGVSLFRLEDGVDNGALIAQQSFNISREEYIADVLTKSVSATYLALSETFKKYPNIVFLPQSDQDRIIWPQRTPADGLVDLSWDGDKVLRYVRSLSRPYPGAFTYHNGKKLIIWKAHLKTCAKPDSLTLSCGDGTKLVLEDWEYTS